MTALNAGDEPALCATLHFPALPGSRGQDGGRGISLAPTLATSSPVPARDWHHSEWDFSHGLSPPGPAKVHLDVQFTRLSHRQFGHWLVSRSLWIVTEHGGCWGPWRRRVELRGLICMNRFRLSEAVDDAGEDGVTAFTLDGAGQKKRNPLMMLFSWRASDLDGDYANDLRHRRVDPAWRKVLGARSARASLPITWVMKHDRQLFPWGRSRRPVAASAAPERIFA